MAQNSKKMNNKSSSKNTVVKSLIVLLIVTWLGKQIDVRIPQVATINKNTSDPEQRFEKKGKQERVENSLPYVEINYPVVRNNTNSWKKEINKKMTTSKIMLEPVQDSSEDDEDMEEYESSEYDGDEEEEEVAEVPIEQSQDISLTSLGSTRSAKKKKS